MASNNPKKQLSVVGGDNKCILLVGSTGNGKSALGSFLCDPTSSLSNPSFARGNSWDSCTKHVQTATAKFGNNSFIIIDTPGLNDSSGSDADHMLELANVLSNNADLSAIIICIQLNTKMDTQFRYTLAYYCEMFRFCLETNVMIVITQVKMDAKERRMRARNNFHVEESADQIKSLISSIAGFDLNCSVWLIDSVVDEDDGGEYLLSLVAREAILTDCASKPSVAVGDMKLVKTRDLQKADDGRLSFIKGQLLGYKKAMVDRSELTLSQSAKIDELVDPIRIAKIDLARIDSELKRLNVDCLIPVKTKDLRSGWSTTWNSQRFKIHTPCLLEDYSIVSSAPYWLENVIVGQDSIEATFAGEWSDANQACVTCFAKSGLVHAQRIYDLIICRERLLLKMVGYNGALESLRSDLKSAGEDSERLFSFIKQMEQRAERLGECSIKISEAAQFLSFLADRGIDKFDTELWNVWLELEETR